jgi:hypothetical protein
MKGCVTVVTVNYNGLRKKQKAKAESKRLVYQTIIRSDMRNASAWLRPIQKHWTIDCYLPKTQM